MAKSTSFSTSSKALLPRPLAQIAQFRIKVKRLKRSFIGACVDAKVEGLVRHDLRATYGTRLGEAGYNASDVARFMGHASITTSQRYVPNFPAGAGEAVILKNQRGHNTVTTDDSGALALVVKC